MSINLIVIDADSFDPEDLPGSAGSYYAFDAMVGDFQPQQQQLDRILRLGTDGHRLRETGVRGDEFPIRTLLYVETRQDAVDAINAYVALDDGVAYEIYQKGQSWGFFNVLKIGNHEPIACDNMIGVLNTNARFKHYVDFLIVATDPPEEAP